MQQFTQKDHYYMQRALELAAAVKGTTLPNPAVGAVIVKNGRVIATGETAPCGGPHAERVALARAGKAAKGAVMYVSLEPCCHFGRTPPCTDAIIEAGIAAVVVALRDPNPLVAGKGIAKLRRSGIQVSCGCMRKEAARLNEDFIYAITHNRAFITLKMAMTFDGFIADSSGASRWITSPEQRKEVHALRRGHAAVAVGNGTLNADDPHLDVRYGTRTRPARIIFSSTDAIASNTFFYTHAHQTRSIVVVRGNGEQNIMIDTSSGIEYWYTGDSDPQSSMQLFTSMAFGAGLTSVLVEGGAIIAGTMLGAGLVNRLHLFYGNKILGGGKHALPIGGGLPIGRCISLSDKSVKVVDGAVSVSGVPLF